MHLLSCFLHQTTEAVIEEKISREVTVSVYINTWRNDNEVQKYGAGRKAKPRGDKCGANYWYIDMLGPVLALTNSLPFVCLVTKCLY